MVPIASLLDGQKVLASSLEKERIFNSLPLMYSIVSGGLRAVSVSLLNSFHS